MQDTINTHLGWFIHFNTKRHSFIITSEYLYVTVVVVGVQVQYNEERVCFGMHWLNIHFTLPFGYNTCPENKLTHPPSKYLIFTTPTTTSLGLYLIIYWHHYVLDITTILTFHLFIFFKVCLFYHQHTCILYHLYR